MSGLPPHRTRYETGVDTLDPCSTQKILAHARMVESGAMKADPIVEAISLELDIFNIL